MIGIPQINTGQHAFALNWSFNQLLDYGKHKRMRQRGATPAPRVVKVAIFRILKTPHVQCNKILKWAIVSKYVTSFTQHILAGLEKKIVISFKYFK